MPSAPSTSRRWNATWANESHTMRYPLLLSALLLGGCQSLSGLTGATTFACKVPDGVRCASVSSVYANGHAGALPSQRTASATRALASAAASPAATPAAGEPLRSAPRILRIWLAPWIDDDGTLHDQAFLYTQVDPGRWLLGETRQRVTEPAVLRRAGAPHAIPPAVQTPVRDAGDKPLADVRNNAGAQAAAQAVVRSAQGQGDRP